MTEKDCPARERYVLWHPHRDAFHSTGGWTTDVGEAMNWQLLTAAEHYQRTRPVGRGTLILTIVVRVHPRALLTMDLLRRTDPDLIDHIRPHPRGTIE